MTFRKALLALTHLASANAIRLLVASYQGSPNTTGSLQTLEFGSDLASFQVTHTNKDCGRNPSWLDISSTTVTCVDEGMPGGSLAMLTMKPDGSLQRLTNATTPAGPVSNVLYNNGAAVALAHYQPPAISTFMIKNNAYIPLQNFTFNLTGPNKERQEISHIHQAILDPTGRFALFPDLGGDVVHVFYVNPVTSMLEEKTPLKSKPGYGPRHATFYVPTIDSGVLFLYVIHELSNKIVSYKVSYPASGGLAFQEVDEVSTFGDREAPKGANAAEITISPDNEFLVASNRLAPFFNVTNPDPNNSTQLQSDSIVTFKPSDCGTLEFVQLAPSGGLNPRHFSLNKDGSMIAVANSASMNVIIYPRDKVSGKIGEKKAAAFGLGPGPLTNVLWLEG
ncbi:Lactonase, 7-bladed beta-propeller-domain-containing protein [Phaeosphaeriaceae sp. PMI808]|nr:Lactonase, 7-bladed beta-propeller-domain-containing protein [Phaeosphaeriaceae sp. PMI808]